MYKPITATTTVFLVAVVTLFTIYWLWSRKGLEEVDFSSNLTEDAKLLNQKLKSALSDSTILPHNHSAFKKAVNFHWAKQECEVVPACVVRPRDVEQVSAAITILNTEYEDRRKEIDRKGDGFFAIRSGGHSPVRGAASIKGGIVIDLSLLRQVMLSEDDSRVTIGVGCRWKQVYENLEKRGLTVAGGRTSEVGVGGLVVAGGISYFIPQIGLVCSNVISYEVVVASGSIFTASSTTNTDLWRALKGGSNNFGVVTSITVPSFPCSKIWSGLLYITPGKAQKVLKAFHEYVNRADSGDHPTRYDDHAAGPLACFTYAQNLGIQIICVQLVHTKPAETGNQWPTCWKFSSFSSIWRLWSTCKVRTIANATEELTALNPAGKRQEFGTTTVKNDLATLMVVHRAYSDAVSRIRHVKNIIWTVVLQPFLPVWASKGDPSPLGLDVGTTDPLVNIQFTVQWTEGKDDELVKKTTRNAVEEIDAFAKANKTGHRYRLLNYCGEWQKPFESYGEDNLRFLRKVSMQYDPEGLFQKGCKGGFKLGIEYCKATQ